MAVALVLSSLHCAQIVTVFGEYQSAQRAAAGQPVSSPVARRLDGALLAIGTLADTLKSTVSGLSCMIRSGHVHV